MAQPMKGFMSVEVDTRRATRLFQNLQFKIPEASRDIQKEFGSSLIRRLRRELTVQNLKFTNTLYNRLKWTQKKDYGYLTMPIYGEFLDRGKPHWVSFKRRVRLMRWAMSKGNLNVQLQLQRGAKGAIFVRPHPWIDAPLYRTINAIPELAQRVLDRKLNEAKT